MLKTIARLEKVIAEKTYHFLLDTDSRIDHAKEALLQFLGVVTQIEEAQKQAAAQAEANKPVEPPAAPQETTPAVTEAPKE